MVSNHRGTNSLSSWLLAFSQRKLTEGRLDIKDPNGRKWSLYFQSGYLIGESGGVHPIRRWHRQLSRYCPHIDIAAAGAGKLNCQYESLAKRVRINQIRREQMIQIVCGNIAETLFDLIQYEELNRHDRQAPLIYTYIPRDTLYSSPLVFISPEEAWLQSQQAWQSWRQAGLTHCFPNLAPVLTKPAELKTSANAYRSFIALVDGERTIRDLASKLKQEPLLLAQSIMPYVRGGAMQLIEIEDLNYSAKQMTTVRAKTTPRSSPSNPAQPNSSAPLIAHIDDSPRDGQIMAQIVTQAGYRYVNLQDSVLALPTLLEKKPNLIFLDLVMPIANGYEICAQIRRALVFKDTPVIIVTSNDGIIDRVRAKLVRSTDFLAKPINAEKVQAILRRYLPAYLVERRRENLNNNHLSNRKRF